MLVSLTLLLLIAAWYDWRYRRIPNLLLFSAMIAGVGWHGIDGTAQSALGGLALALVLTLLPVALRGMGMGDQKLLMAVGAWTGAAQLYELFILSMLICLLVIVVQPQKWLAVFHNLQTMLVGWQAHRILWLPTRYTSAVAIPYAVCLLLAHLVWLWGR